MACGGRAKMKVPGLAEQFIEALRGTAAIGQSDGLDLADVRGRPRGSDRRHAISDTGSQETCLRLCGSADLGLGKNLPSPLNLG